MGDSKELWLSLHETMPRYDITLGRAIAQGYVSDARMITFIASRYKFCAKMLDGFANVMEIGCGDAFGAPIVAQSVGNLVCTDIDEATLKENKERCKFFKNIEFEYYDFRLNSHDRKFDGVYLVDVIEHVYPEETAGFMKNIVNSIHADGVALFGTPNKAAEQYASENSKIGHVNVMDGKELKSLCQKYFKNVFMFGMNDEVVHTGYMPMAHYLWALAVGPRTAPA